MNPNPRTRRLTPLNATVAVDTSCSTMERVLIDVTASLMPDPDLPLEHPDFYSDVAIKRIAYELELNPVQLLKLRAIKSELVAICREDKAEQDKLIYTWLEELSRPRMDEANLYALIEERERLAERYAPRVMDKVVDFHASLGDEQKEWLASRTEKMRDWKPKG